ncbi:universal stress protein UspA-like protein [Desulfomonile tiedjei DSM 6799]|uniref:Universal stress protein UspA-like protein n=2 Tax=Desulfomonile tiedjei TaxID=2358 RepID=I4C098_DESTA|nr:universal stress protein UspA-like protein [Desulfomonile tiedjei DSM 6799]
MDLQIVPCAKITLAKYATIDQMRRHSSPFERISFMPKRILYCTDFSHNSLPARGYAIEFARAFDAELIVLHVVNTKQIGFPSLESVPADMEQQLLEIQKSAEKALQLLEKELSRSVDNVQSRLRTGTPFYEIVKCASDEAADLIIMGTHGRTGFPHLIIGSTAENVVRTSQIPVLTVKSSLQ